MSEYQHNINLRRIIDSPPIIEPLNYDTIYQEILSDFLARDPEYSALVETDPALILIQAFAYRELYLRQRVNDAARGVMIGYAVGDDLEALAEIFKVTREEGENDEVFRQRILDSIEAHPTAGSWGSYYYYTMNVKTELGGVRDTYITHSTPGTVAVTVMAQEEPGLPNEIMLLDVLNALNAESVRPLTDNVTVSMPTQTYDYTVDIVLFPYQHFAHDAIYERVEKALINYVAERRMLGHTIYKSGLCAVAHQEGVETSNITLKLEGEVIETDIEVSHTEFAFCSAYTIIVNDI